MDGRELGSIVPVIVTHERRASHAARLVTQLEAIGLRPRLREQREPPSRVMQHLNSLEALRMIGRSPGMFLEDDVDLVHPELLASALPAMDRVTVLCLVAAECNPRQVRLARAQALRPRIIPIWNERRWGGSQAVYFPAGMAARAYAWLSVPGTVTTSHASDSMLKKWMLDDLKQPFDTLVPNPFQHLDLPSLVPKKRLRTLEALGAKFDVDWPVD